MVCHHNCTQNHWKCRQMDPVPNEWVDFSPLISALRSKQVWEFDPSDEEECRDLPQAVFDALQSPVDFPPLEAAIVPEDRVAIAVDPNIPSVADVVQGAIKAIGLTQASAIDVVLTDEASETTLHAIRDLVDSDVNVLVHHSFERDGLRYLGADQDADPIYLNRYLVDADFVLPIVAARPGDLDGIVDVTGVTPAFADSASRLRFASTSGQQLDAAWQLGIHLMVTVVPTKACRAATCFAGTPYDADQRRKLSRSEMCCFPETPELAIVSLDGDPQQQTWSNAARAIRLATRHTDPGATIVLWSELESAPEGQLLTLSDDEEFTNEPIESDDGFPVWDETIWIAAEIRSVAAEYRLMIHSRINRETIESLGLGVVESVEELSCLSESFDSCGVIRAAQFGGVSGVTARSREQA